MESGFFDTVMKRRTIYALNKETVIKDKEIIDIVKNAVKYSPSAFNSQSGRTVVLFGSHHDKLWDTVREALRKVVPKEIFADTEKRIGSFRNGYGTVLFFEDQNVVEFLQNNYPLYRDNFPVWSQQSSGMMQYIVWAALEEKGLGASLQHYNPLIDEEVKKDWNIPAAWKLIAQMPFGKPTAPPGEKEFEPIDGRVKVFQ